MALTWKWFYISIFTTNHFQVRRTKREIEREKEEIIELTPLTPILSLTSPPITELTHSRWAQPLDPLPHGSLIVVSFFVSSWFLPQFDGVCLWVWRFYNSNPHTLPHLTSDLHSSNITSPPTLPHLTSPSIYTTPTSPHLTSTICLIANHSLTDHSLADLLDLFDL